MDNDGMRIGTVTLRSAGPLAFGPDGILFLADSVGATVFAVDIADEGTPAGATPLDLNDIDIRVGALLGCDAGDIAIRDVAVHPISGNVYLSVQRGRGELAQAVLVRIDRLAGDISDVALSDVPHAAVTIDDAPAEDDGRLDITLPLDDEGELIEVGQRKIRILRRPIRTSTITDIAFVDGTLLVAGLSNEEFSSKLRRIPYPFAAAGASATVANNLEIFHVSHGKWETAAPIRAFVSYEGGRSILATYTCTPLVHFSLSQLEPGTKTIGRTVAELGAVNQPLDMVSFMQDAEEKLLVANSSHGLLKLSIRDIDAQTALTEPTEPVGVPRTVEDLQGVSRLANLGPDHVLLLQTDDEGRQHLRSLATTAL